MLSRIKNLLAGAAQERPDWTGPRDLRFAAAALLVEAAAMDGAIDTAERDSIVRLLSAHFDLDAAEAQALLAAAETAVEDATELVRFTRTVKAEMVPTARIALVEMLWEVAYADGALHHFEANLLRRVAGLLYVSDRDSGAARQRVLRRLGLGADSSG